MVSNAKNQLNTIPCTFPTYQEKCLGIFRDLKKAFDVCSHKILIRKVKKYVWRDGYCSFLIQYCCYLKNRSQRIDINGTLSNENIFKISFI
jgi:hypothetical protein